MGVHTYIDIYVWGHTNISRDRRANGDYWYRCHCRCLCWIPAHTQYAYRYRYRCRLVYSCRCRSWCPILAIQTRQSECRFLVTVTVLVSVPAINLMRVPVPDTCDYKRCGARSLFARHFLGSGSSTGYMRFEMVPVPVFFPREKKKSICEMKSKECP